MIDHLDHTVPRMTSDLWVSSAAKLVCIGGDIASSADARRQLEVSVTVRYVMGTPGPQLYHVVKYSTEVQAARYLTLSGQSGTGVLQDQSELISHKVTHDG